MRYRLLRITPYGAVLAGALSASAAFADSTILDNESPMYQRVTVVSKKWRDAVIDKNIDELVQLVEPQSRELVREYFSDTKTDLFQVTFGVPVSELIFFMNTAPSDVIYIEKKRGRKTMGVDVCYYDRKKVDINKIDPVTLPMVNDGIHCVCRYFYILEEDGKLYASYTILME